jgi:hypothetical protein
MPRPVSHRNSLFLHITVILLLVTLHTTSHVRSFSTHTKCFFRKVCSVTKVYPVTPNNNFFSVSTTVLTAHQNVQNQISHWHVGFLKCKTWMFHTQFGLLHDPPLFKLYSCNYQCHAQATKRSCHPRLNYATLCRWVQGQRNLPEELNLQQTAVQPQIAYF